MKRFRWAGMVLLGLFVLSCARGGTYPLYLRYQPVKSFPELSQKMGTSLALAPVKDIRPSTLHVGMHTPLAGNISYFRSAPSSLDKAIMDSLSRVLPSYGIKVAPISAWDGKPESLKEIHADSVFLLEVKKFWAEGAGSITGTRVTISFECLIHLGVKREAKVYTRTVGVEKAMTIYRLTPEWMETTLNELLAEVFDSYFSNPY